MIAAALDGLARAFCLQVIAPVFWFALLGLPGVFLQQTVRTAAVFLSARQLQAGAKRQGSVRDLQILPRSDFAVTALRLDKALSFLPLLLADAMLIAAALFIPGCSPAGAVRQAFSNRGNVAATLGGLLGLSQQGLLQMERTHIERAVAVFAVACLINAGLVAALLWLRAVF